MGLYTNCVRPLAFRLEAEQAHQLALKLGANMAWAARAEATLGHERLSGRSRKLGKT